MNPTDQSETKSLVKFLRQYNLWRRGDETLEMPHPRDIGNAIDGICDLVEESEERWIRCEDRFPEMGEESPAFMPGRMSMDAAAAPARQSRNELNQEPTPKNMNQEPTSSQPIDITRPLQLRDGRLVLQATIFPDAGENHQLLVLVEGNATTVSRRIDGTISSDGRHGLDVIYIPLEWITDRRPTVYDGEEDGTVAVYSGGAPEHYVDVQWDGVGSSPWQYWSKASKYWGELSPAPLPPSTSKSAREWFKSLPPEYNHRKIHRHHLGQADGVPGNVNLLDVLEYIADCVMAGMARSGSVYDLEMPPELLTRAFENTVELLKAEVSVSDANR